MDNEFGKHYLVEFINCNAEKLKYVKDVKKVFISAAKKSNATILKYYFNQFKPTGVSGIMLIAESHFSIHTWPDHDYAAFDMFSCGHIESDIAISILRTGFEAEKAEVKIISRGRLLK
ncbi:MAG: S-adenosylmethionine decarboxylase proenzyme [Omnitrophica WOR_2 bacterium GWF2_38_59]|nr:MAG: S-adenosylmethionine decarboxylase proenzyme [Omnitrophica WOR_2 bacterium GWF2_38_59]OGX50507.1 MAG: S-adenosylmethionine decarboxylase proenzyme [Omnitrophica WOR_2 bacterium RIFOXYA2_FULL_38_17]OGX54498.1 MAG: S-adenosylmethionine decarboxylase proenzyme [Omnitrophica WOR_2 bacterium RIFOXYA12_FULL_38_10]OGX55410.1 MAG: S-adenosylmethionine decarboxylase proenzyme [Omnitrophica WOR_2 bacterium RIFOXYC2_FULL_38_12]OGX59516.1 MAG: S-adenosylmethionine decarboxylase proenzyme [Omnitroph